MYFFQFIFYAIFAIFVYSFVIMEALLTDLLLRHNCVIIPDLGGFVASRVPAYVDEVKGKVFPPSKQLTFNSRLIKNDGLLVSAWAEKENITFDEAAENVKKESQLIQQKLRKGQNHPIENIGVLFMNEEGRINFRQDRYFNMLLDAYGLDPVEFISVDLNKENDSTERKQKSTPVQVEKIENKVEVQSASTSTKEKAETRSKAPVKNLHPSSTRKKVLRYAAAAALLPIAFYSFWIPLTSDVLESKVLFKQDFNPFTKKAESVYQADRFNAPTIAIHEEDQSLTQLQEKLPENVFVFHYALTEDLYVPVWRKELKNKPQEEVASQHASEETISRSDASTNYHLIAGCFREIDNANGLVEKLNSRGLNAYILDQKDGLHRVTAAQVKDKSLLDSERNSLHQKGFKTWVLRK